MAEFNTVHIVSLENASRFFSGAPVKICHIPVNFFMTIAKIFHNPLDVSYVVLSSKLVAGLPLLQNAAWNIGPITVHVEFQRGLAAKILQFKSAVKS